MYKIREWWTQCPPQRRLGFYVEDAGGIVVRYFAAHDAGYANAHREAEEWIEQKMLDTEK